MKLLLRELLLLVEDDMACLRKWVRGLSDCHRIQKGDKSQHVTCTMKTNTPNAYGVNFWFLLKASFGGNYSSLTLYSIMTPLKYHVFENIM